MLYRSRRVSTDIVVVSIVIQAKTYAAIANVSSRNADVHYLKQNSFLSDIAFTVGRAIAQAVSRRLPTLAARVQTRVWSCGIL
jgi:hypothetical protein